MTDNVVNITRKIDRLRKAIRDSLAARGEAHVDLTDSSMPVDEWRKIARAAARELGRPVETIAHDDRAWAVLRDWPSSPHEQAIHDAAMRAAVEGTALH